MTQQSRKYYKTNNKLIKLHIHAQRREVLLSQSNKKGIVQQDEVRGKEDAPSLNFVFLRREDKSGRQIL